MGKVLRLYGIGRVFESRGGSKPITFYLFLFTSFSKSFFIVLFATYSVNVNFRDYSYHVDHMNPLFPCDHGAASLPHTHAICMTQDVVRYVKMRTSAARGLQRYKIVEICGLTGS